MGTAATTTYDVATLTGAGGHPGADALAMVGPVGLRLWKPDDEVEEPALIDGGSWAGARRLTTHPLDSHHVWGVDAAERRVLQMAENNGVWSAAPAIPAAGITTAPILAIAAIDWDGQGGLDLALLTQNGLRVYDHQGYPLTFEIAYPALSGSITRVAADNHDGDWIAWLAPKPPGQTGSVLAVLDLATVEVVDLGTTPFVAVTAGDCTVDGREDLLLARDDTTEATILFNGFGSPMPPPWTVFAHVPGCGARIGIKQPNEPSAANAAPALLSTTTATATCSARWRARAMARC